MNYKALGFQKTAASFGATRNLYKALQAEGYEIVRNKPAPGIAGLISKLDLKTNSSWVDNKAKIISISKGPHVAQPWAKSKRVQRIVNSPRSARDDLFHEGGHTTHPAGMSTDNVPFGILHRERAANEGGINLLKKHEAPEHLEQSIKQFKKNTYAPYASHKRPLVGGIATIMKVVDDTEPAVAKGFIGKLKKGLSLDLTRKTTMTDLRRIYDNNPDLRKKHYEY